MSDPRRDVAADLLERLQVVVRDGPGTAHPRCRVCDSNLFMDGHADGCPVLEIQDALLTEPPDGREPDALREAGEIMRDLRRDADRGVIWGRDRAGQDLMDRADHWLAVHFGTPTDSPAGPDEFDGYVAGYDEAVTRYNVDVPEDWVAEMESDYNEWRRSWNRNRRASDSPTEKTT